jgi:uracil-DNA glycosylase
VSGRQLARALLRQRAELGDAEIVLTEGRAAELLEALAPRAAPPPPRGAPPSRDVSLPRAPGASRGAEPPAAAPAAPTAVHPPIAPGSYEEAASLAAGCTRCALSASRSRVVFSDGPQDAPLMVVGEAPGAEEDRQGVPFVGRAGRLLDLLLASCGQPRETVYICNVLKCRPPGNRDPLPEEVEACRPFLQAQIEAVRPRVVLACGSFAARTLLGVQEPVGRLRGRVHALSLPGGGEVPLVVTYHPAALLRNPGWVRASWEDLQRARSVLQLA